MSTTKNLSKNVLIHDAARPCVSLEDMKKIIYYSSNSTTGISPGYPLTNALKRVNKNSIVIDNLKRNNLYMSFTPQAYNFSKFIHFSVRILPKPIFLYFGRIKKSTNHIPLKVFLLCMRFVDISPACPTMSFLYKATIGSCPNNEVL